MSSAWKKLINTKQKTELPHYAINKNLPSDSYFTNKETAIKCIDIVNKYLKENNEDNTFTFIEPSCGSGVFYDLLPENKRIGIELHDRNRKEFIKADYLEWYPNKELPYFVIGNPPFGVRGAIALAFINRSFLFSEYVAFILPMSFHSNGKGSNMKRVVNGHLVHSEILEGKAFSSPDNGKEIKPNTMFQIWKRGEGESIFKEYDVSEYADIYTVCSSPARRCGMDKLNEYDFYVTSSYFGDTLSTVYNFEDVKYGSGYGIIIKKNKKDIMEKMKDVNWDDYSSPATHGCKHVRRYAIEKCLFDNGFGKILEQGQMMEVINSMKEMEI